MQDLFARKKHGVRLLMAASVIRRSATISASESSALIESQAWRVGRVAEGARLESVYTLIRIVGSNPTLSAKYTYKSVTYKFNHKTSHIPYHINVTDDVFRFRLPAPSQSPAVFRSVPT